MAAAVRWQRPGVWGLLAGIGRGLRKRATSASYWVGVVFLLTNVPLGYAFAGLGALMVAATGNARWALIGSIGYGITWLMLGLSFVLLGKRGVMITKSVVSGKWKAWRRMRRR